MGTNSNQSIVEIIEPASGIINIDELLNNIEEYISERAILPPGASSAITLWCLASYDINIFRIFPKLTIYSPEKRCGKSTLLDLIEAFSSKSYLVSNITPAAIYRLINQCQPTLIIDEADTFVAGSSGDLRGIINSGHARRRAYVARCDGETNEPVRFSTWTPMVFASIGKLETTIMDRSISIPLRRKMNNEIIKPIEVDLYEKAKTSRKQLLKWIRDHSEKIGKNIKIFA